MRSYSKPIVTSKERDELAIAFEKATVAAQEIYKDCQDGFPTEKGFKDIVKRRWAYIILTEFYDWKEGE